MKMEKMRSKLHRIQLTKKEDIASCFNDKQSSILKQNDIRHFSL